jgi:hypothetical protein
MSDLKLPKDVVADPRHASIAELLASRATPLWAESPFEVATLAPNDALLAELRAALGKGEACQGLELVADELAAEQRGIDALRRKSPEAAPSPRVSRVLFVSADGSTRFYRDVESLLRKYADRLLVVRLDVPGDALGEAVLPAPRLVRAVLVKDKRAAAKALLALSPAAPSR